MDELQSIRRDLEDLSKTILGGLEYQYICRALAALYRLETREAEAPKDARAIAATVRAHTPRGSVSPHHLMSEQQAAAEIERHVQSRIAAVPKTVPMAMLEEIASSWPSLLPRETMRRIVDSYGYEVTE